MKRQFSTGVAALVVVVLVQLGEHVIAPGLQTCAWLDRALKRTGCIRLLEMHPMLEGKGFSTGFAFSSDGTILASSGEWVGEHPEGGVAARAGVEWWRVAGRNPVRLLEFSTDPQIEATALSPDGMMLAVATRAGIALWTRSTDGAYSGEPLSSPTSGDLAFSPDGTLLAVRSGTEVSLWRLPDRTLAQTLHVQEGDCRGMAFTADGSLVIVGSTGHIAFWSLADGTAVRELPARSSRFALSADGTTLVTEDTVDPWTFEVWRLPGGTLLHRIERPPDSSLIFTFALSPQTSVLAGADGHKLWLWRLADEAPLRVMKIEASAVAFSPDGTLAVKRSDGSVGLFRVKE